MDEYAVIECPHCGLYIQIFKIDLNCGIFRHGSSLINGALINLPPHASREFVESLKVRGTLLGCGGPFKINAAGGAEVCDWSE